MKGLLRLYPVWWRVRYGAEMAALLDDLPRRARVAMAVDLLRGALDARFALAKESGMSSPTGRSIRRSIVFALAVWVALSVDIVLTNVVFPSRNDDDTLDVLLAYLVVFAVLAAVGFVAAREGTQMIGVAISGAVAGAVIGLLTIGTFLVVDNVWLDIVSQQQTKIDGLARSGGGSMRAYINGGLLGGAVVLPLLLASFGVVLALGGGGIANWRRSRGATRELN
jgi:pheromone shutdown protein TraB